MQHGRERRVAKLAALLARLSGAEVARVREAAELVERALAEQPRHYVKSVNGGCGR